MSTSAVDGSEDVIDFLERIKEIGKRRDQEDEERNRKLEEEIIQGRKERQARRAERARSISPTKSSPANTPTKGQLSSAQKLSLSDFPYIGSPGGSEPKRDISDSEHKSGAELISPTNESIFAAEVNYFHSNVGTGGAQDISERPPPNATLSPRLPTLLWKRRLSSQVSDYSPGYSLSMHATPDVTESSKVTPASSPKCMDKTLGDQTKKSLAMKDLSWLQNSSSGDFASKHRRALSEYGANTRVASSDKIERPSTASEKHQSEPEINNTSPHSTSTSKPSLYSSGEQRSYGSHTTSLGELGLLSSLKAPSKVDSHLYVKNEDLSPIVSPTRGRISPERLDRSSSPTKGMGGFVQSAMMKRSDSVNKRWNVQSSPTLNRVDSLSKNRDNGSVLASSIAKSSYANRENSPDVTPRTRSNISGSISTHERPPTSLSLRNSVLASKIPDSNPGKSNPALFDEAPSGLLTAPQIPTDLGKSAETPSASPSKATDRRRWSPTKSSWLEAALNKQESPKSKPKAVALPQQPIRISEANKIDEKSSIEICQNSATAPKHEATVGGLARLSPKSSPTKLSAGASPTKTFTGTSNTRTDSPDFVHPQKSISNSISSTNSPLPSYTPKTKSETSLEYKLRANLKPRKLQLGNTDSDESEFKNIFVKLRPTKTQNYVAPDELKNNITRGKAALNLTNGPQKTERIDEFKEAILKKKEDFKKAQLEGKGVTRSQSTTWQSNLPEALLKRETLARKGSVSNLSNITNLNLSQRFNRHSSNPNMIAASRAHVRELEKIVNRANPELAGLINHRLSSSINDLPRPSGLANSVCLTSEDGKAVDYQQSGARLTHLTKQRARGPRRKPPTCVSIPDLASNFQNEGKENLHFASLPTQTSLLSESINSELKNNSLLI